MASEMTPVESERPAWDSGDPAALRFGVTICRRRADGTLWRNSHPGHPGWLWFYFRAVEPIAEGSRCYCDTGPVWYFKDHGLFEIVTTGAVIVNAPKFLDRLRLAWRGLATLRQTAGAERTGK